MTMSSRASGSSLPISASSLVAVTLGMYHHEEEIDGLG
jgi:hypothetical protein